MPKVTFFLNDVNDRLSVAYAKAQGYRFTLHGDGNAEIANDVGHVCRILGFKCDCPDKWVNGGTYNGRCQHEIWVAQLLPCDVCGGIMGLGVFFSCFGMMMERFECPVCGNVRDFELVRIERGMRRNGRSPRNHRQAIEWIKAIWRQAIRSRKESLDGKKNAEYKNSFR